MPNRVLKDSIKRSPQIDSLTWFEEVLFYRLIVTVDDYGCTDGRIIVVRSDLFPTKDNITKKAIEEALDHLAKVGLIVRYQVNGVEYIFLPSFEKHQRVRNKRCKYPLPPQEVLNDSCLTIDGQLTADCLPESESESNPNPIPNPVPNPVPNPIQSESDDSATASAAPAVAELPLIDGSMYAITEDEREKDAASFPAVDVMQQYREMARWLDSNPKNRKTRNGIRRFINSWLSREQDKAPRVKARTPGQAYNPFADALMGGDVL